jgi:hypothetical protein
MEIEDLCRSVASTQLDSLDRITLVIPFWILDLR